MACKKQNDSVIRFRLPKSTASLLKSRAARYTSGNMSEFIRQAIEAYKRKCPPKK